MGPPPLMTWRWTVALSGCSSSRFGPIEPVEPASLSVWQPLQFELKTVLPWADAEPLEPLAADEEPLDEPPPPPPQAVTRSAEISATAMPSLNMRGTLPGPPGRESRSGEAPYRPSTGEGRPLGRPSQSACQKPDRAYAASFSIGTSTRLPHSVHEPS